MSEVSVRRATLGDSEALIRLMEGLAAYEKLTPPDDAAKARFRSHLAEGTRFEAVLAEIAGAAIGYALYFESYSTFRANPKLYMEDIFVEPDHRKPGAGLAVACSVGPHHMRCAACLLTNVSLANTGPAIRIRDII